ncbi:MAG: MBOAT family protein, partial [Ruminiclostridium sp.]|nr:MBOAT family protein [Ruminiclostridium sp.]
MVFSSLPFLFLFLTVVLLVSHILPFKFRNFFLLLANLVFYAYGEPIYILIMIGSILVNYICGLLIGKQSSKGGKRAVLVVGIVLNLAALGVFKYAGLFVGTFKDLTGITTIPDVNIALPIGISFYTFQAVSYLIDVYWQDCEASRNFVNFACYISLFPQLI